jgi:hypothetical protein
LDQCVQMGILQYNGHVLMPLCALLFSLSFFLS